VKNVAKKRKQKSESEQSSHTESEHSDSEEATYNPKWSMNLKDHPKLEDPSPVHS